MAYEEQRIRAGIHQLGQNQTTRQIDPPASPAQLRHVLNDAINDVSALREDIGVLEKALGFVLTPEPPLSGPHPENLLARQLGPGVPHSEAALAAFALREHLNELRVRIQSISMRVAL